MLHSHCLVCFFRVWNFSDQTMRYSVYSFTWNICFAGVIHPGGFLKCEKYNILFISTSCMASKLFWWLVNHDSSVFRSLSRFALNPCFVYFIAGLMFTAMNLENLQHFIPARTIKIINSDLPFKCVQCPKSFNTKHKLNQHLMTHSGLKPYKCSFCDKRFKQLSHVQQHTRLHTGERPFRCPLPDCGRAFTQQSNLKQHIRSHQNPEGRTRRLNPKAFHCPICGKGFTAESSVGIHTSMQHATLLSRDIKPSSTSLATSTLPGYYYPITDLSYNNSISVSVAPSTSNPELEPKVEPSQSN